MGAVRSSLVLNDGMSAVLRRINKAMSLTLDTFNAVQQASGQAFDPANITAARQEIGKANAAIEEMEQNFRDCNNQQNTLNKNMAAGTSAANGLLGKVKSIAAAYLGMKGIGWVKDSLALFDTQNNAETQLQTVLKNMGGSSEAFASLKAKASELQGKTAYGDEILLGGAAEFATYMSDDAAISKMMETLTNYAAGMSGGGEIGYEEMVNYATGLGKIMTGSYDAMTKKGFEFTDQQKKIIENGTDMEKALVISEVINESWAGLAEQMANTPEGKIISLKNSFGDMREELGARVYPAVMQLFNTISANSGSLHGIITGLATPINLILVITTKLVNGIANVYNYVNKYWGKIGPIVYGIAGAFAAYNAALLVHKAYLLGAAIVQGIKTVAEYANAKATLKAAEAAGVNTAALTGEAAAAALAAAGLTAEQVAAAGATVAQTGFNTALWACPITWIIAAVIVLIVLFAMFTEQIMGAIFWLGSLFKNIGLWIANCGVAAWQVIKNVGLWFANLGLAIWQVIKNIGSWFANLGASAWAIIKNTGLWFANLGMGIWNVLKAAASNVGTAFSNAWIGIQIGFWTMLDVIMQGIKKLAEKANKCLGWMGVNIDTSGLDFASKKIDELNGKKESYQSISDAWSEGFNTFAYDSVSDAWNSHDYGSVSDAMGTFDYGSVGDAFNTFDTFQDGWGSEAYAAGAEVGAGIKDWMGDNLSLSGILGKAGLDGTGVTDALGYGDTLDDISGDTSSLADSTDKTTEELAYLRDIAEQEAINRFTTAEVKIDMTGMTNRIDGSLDIDGVVDELTTGFVDALTTAAEGVHDDEL